MSRFRLRARGCPRTRLWLRALEDRCVPAALLVNLTGDANTGTGLTGDLRYCIGQANTDAADDTITFDSAVFAGATTITLAGSELAITEAKGLTIQGPGAAKLTITPGGSFRAFNINVASATPTIALTDMTVAGANSTVDGAGVNVTSLGTVSLTNMAFTNNKTTGNAAAISATTAGTSLTVTGCTFTGNTASLNGGALRCGPATITINGSTFTNNTATSNGGALYMQSTITLNINTSNFTGNTVTSTAGGGGALNTNGNSTVTVTNSSFLSNKAAVGGAFRFNSSGFPAAVDSVTFDTCNISSNSATNGAGGGILLVAGSPLTITNSTLSTNTSTAGGGGLSMSNPGGSCTITNSTISGNTSGGTVGGGGILASSSSFSGTLAVSNSTVVNNTATGGKGGGIFVNSANGTVTLSSTILASNTNPINRDLAASALRNVGGNNNLIGSVDTTLITLTGTNNPSLLGTEASPLSPGIFSLGNYGGSTPTHPLGYNSPALNAGNNSLSLSFDQRGAGFPRTVGTGTDIGAFEGTLPNPYIAGNTLTNVTTAGATTYSFKIVYADDIGINLTTLGKGEVTVTGPSGYFTATPVLKSTSVAGTQATATYQFTPPGGTWDVTDGGNYTVTLAGNSVFDTDPTPHAAFAQTVGTINVGIVGTMIVDSTADAVDGNTGAGQLTLREAIGISNNSLGGLDTINFAGSLSGKTITLGGTDLSITDPVVIQGPGAANLTISANQLSRIFTFNILGAGAASTISGLTLTKGLANSGGAINMADDSLNLSNVVLTQNASNTAGGAIVMTSSTLTVTDSTLSSNAANGGTGGAIQATSTTAKIQLTRCTLSGNTSTVNGGALYSNSGIITITDSTISGNSTSNTSIGGGGLGGSNPTITLTNTTVSGNTATNGTALGGAMRLAGGSLTVNNSTIAKNAAAAGGGIAVTSAATCTFNSSIIAQNTAATHPDLEFTPTTTLTIDGDNNLIGAADEPNISFTGGANLTGTTAAPLDAKLAPLGNYGGPTRTHGLLSGSPAINMGNNLAGLSFDQRGSGFPRVLGEGPDIGSFEGDLNGPIAQVALADVTAAGTTYVATVLYSDDIGIDTSTIDVNDVTLSGPGYSGAVSPVSASFTGSGTQVTATYTFNAPGGSWSVPANGVYTLSQVANQVFDVDTPTAHAAIAGALGTFHAAVPNVYLVDKLGDLDDGNYGPGQLTLREAVKLANTTNLGIADVITFDSALTGQTILLTGELSITDPVIIQGIGAGLLTISGGGVGRVFNFNLAGVGASSTISKLNLTGGTVSGAGGAINANDDALVLSNVVIYGNSAGSAGGAVFTAGSSLTVVNSTLANNSSDSNGGAIDVANGTVLNLTASTLSGNTAAGAGGGVYNVGSTVVTNATFSGNTAGTTGGGLASSPNATLSVSNSTFTRNTAQGAGGGGISMGKGSVTIQSTVVAQNDNNYAPDLYVVLNQLVNVAGDGNFVGVVTGSPTLLGTYLGGGPGAPLNAKLLPLAVNGGPTMTHAPSAFSLLIDAGGNPLGLTTDQRGGGFPRTLGGQTDVGAVEGASTLPFAGTALLDVNITDTQYVATVFYEDATGIDTTTIDTSDVRLSGPGFATPAVPTKVVVNGSGTTVSADYYFTPPGGSWDILDNGRYTLSLVGDVYDTDPTPNKVPAGTLGSFQVSLTGTYVVDSLADEADGNYSAGHLSLREAIGVVNASFGSAETITFAPGLFTAGSQTVTLTLGELLVSNDVTVQGPGADKLTISGNNAARVFDTVNPGTQINVTVAGMSIANGRANQGGGISTGDENVILDGVWLTGNLATVNGGGVAVDTGGVLTIRNSAVTGNTANTTGSGYGGGGIYMKTTSNVVIQNTTIASNTAANGLGGGIACEFFAAGGSLLIQNTTIAGNTAAVKGGGIVVIPSISLLIELDSTIVAGNTTSSGNAVDIYAASVFAANSLVGVADDGIPSFNQVGSLTGTKAAPLDPKLAALGNYGGPTPTRALLPGSPAVDTGSNPQGLTSDQRGTGFPREFPAGSPDIGAVEARPPRVTAVQVNNGAAQRSMVTSLTVTFSEPVAFPNGVAAAFQLNRIGQPSGGPGAGQPLGAVNLGAVQSGNAVTITFAAGGSVPVDAGGSLVDGAYQLTVLASKIQGAAGALDGNGDGTAGDDYATPASGAGRIFRLFGDGNGTGTNDVIDFGLFRTVFGTTDPTFDFDGGGSVDVLDFGQFRQRFGTFV